jgi:DNA-binding MarR family transcriptional regulator
MVKKSAVSEVTPKWNDSYATLAPHLWGEWHKTAKKWESTHIAITSRSDAGAKEVPGLGWVKLIKNDGDFAAFLDHIKDVGIREPIEVDRTGDILNGYTRHLASIFTGVECKCVIVDAPAPHTFVRARKLAHHHLTQGQRMKLVDDEIKDNCKLAVPHSARFLARQLAVSNKTISERWKSLERRGQVEKVTKTVDERGHSQTRVPATKDDAEVKEAQKRKEQKKKDRQSVIKAEFEKLNPGAIVLTKPTDKQGLLQVLSGIEKMLAIAKDLSSEELPPSARKMLSDMVDFLVERTKKLREAIGKWQQSTKTKVQIEQLE